MTIFMSGELDSTLDDFDSDEVIVPDGTFLEENMVVYFGEIQQKNEDLYWVRISNIARYTVYENDEEFDLIRFLAEYKTGVRRVIETDASYGWRAKKDSIPT